MLAHHHSIINAQLTKTIMNKMVIENDGSEYNVFLVSPLGNVFLIGNVDTIEEIEIDKHHTEYLITDAGDVQRKILFHDEHSDYGILLSSHNTVNSTTGLSADDEDDDEFKEFVKWETGQLGQECDDSDSENGETGDYDD